MSEANNLFDEFEFDIYRSMILSSYISKWGIPDCRYVFPHVDGPVEVYSFPPSGDRSEWRFATFGISANIHMNRKETRFEMYLVLPPDLGGIDQSDICYLLMNIAEHSIREDLYFGYNQFFPEISFAPSNWSTRCLLLSLPILEREITQITTPDGSIDLIWLTLISNREYKFLEDNNIDSFLTLVSQEINRNKHEIINPYRKSLV